MTDNKDESQEPYQSSDLEESDLREQVRKYNPTESIGIEENKQ